MSYKLHSTLPSNINQSHVVVGKLRDATRPTNFDPYVSNKTNRDT